MGNGEAGRLRVHVLVLRHRHRLLAFFVLFVLFVLSAVLPAMQPYPLVLYWMCICVSSDELERGMEWGGRASSPRVLLVCLFEEEGVLRAGAASF